MKQKSIGPILSDAPLHVISKARDRIADPDNWTTLAMARGLGQGKVGYDSPSAKKWCATGALMLEIDIYAKENDIGMAAIDILRRNITRIMLLGVEKTEGKFFDRLETFNDFHKHGKVIELFDMVCDNLERGELP